MPARPRATKALIFDVFGTVVDWRGSIIRECRTFGRRKKLAVDWDAFADAWRAGYRPAMARVRSGELPWMNIDQLHRMILDELLERFGIDSLTEDEIDHLNRVWHRLDPWTDARRGLALLKRRHIIATLSNGNVALLVNMAKHGRLPWDTVLSAELFHHYKPDPESYLGVVDSMYLKPHQVMLVAAHNGDLKAAQKCGLSTAFVLRPGEHGPNQKTDTKADGEWNTTGTSMIDVAKKLGC